MTSGDDKGSLVATEMMKLAALLKDTFDGCIGTTRVLRKVDGVGLAHVNYSSNTPSIIATTITVANIRIVPRLLCALDWGLLINCVVEEVICLGVIEYSSSGQNSTSTS